MRTGKAAVAGVAFATLAASVGTVAVAAASPAASPAMAGRA